MTDTARRGMARIRDTDGWVWSCFRRTIMTYAKPAARAANDFGDLTWLRHLDDDHLAQFLVEVRAAVSVAYHDDDLTELEQLVRDWRATADELADPARRAPHELSRGFASRRDSGPGPSDP